MHSGTWGSCRAVRPDADWPAAPVAWGTVAVLALLQGVNAVDRHLINLLVEPIKRDLAINDGQVGLLLGFSFALFYTTFGLPFGRLADYLSRRILVLGGTLFWSAATIACGFAHSFAQLFAARVAVGAGEATLNPAGFSMIADLFPSERRAKPMGVFIAGHTLGQALTLFGGGVLIGYLVDNAVRWHLPFGIVIRDWQIAFVLAGLPGLVIAWSILLAREPQRRETTSGATRITGSALPLADVARFLADRRRLYLPLAGGLAAVLMWHMGNMVWAPSLLTRNFGMAPAEVGLALGMLTLIFNSSGVVLAGTLSEWLSARGRRDAHVLAASLGALCALPFALCAALASQVHLTLLCLAGAFFFGSLPFTLGPAAIAAITPNEMRAQTTALYLLVINAFGFGVGPWLIGSLTDHLFADPQRLGYSIALVAALALPLGAVLLGAAA
ncbi:MAG: MFS transporter, partial [Steroidobacteraceae bacterium]|nr:MFS transporter [Steroidobacteraceae bacterium]